MLDASIVFEREFCDIETKSQFAKAIHRIFSSTMLCVDDFKICKYNLNWWQSHMKFFDIFSAANQYYSICLHTLCNAHYAHFFLLDDRVFMLPSIYGRAGAIGVRYIHNMDVTMLVSTSTAFHTNHTHTHAYRCVFKLFGRQIKHIFAAFEF